MDLAIICKDAASEYVKVDKNFEIVGVLIKNSDLLLKRESVTKKIGITQNRNYQKKLANSMHKNAEIVEIISNALPYAMYNYIVDAAILDGVKVLGLEGDVEYPKIDTETYVLIVNKSFKDKEAYKSFVKAYNQSVQALNNKEVLIDTVEKYKGIELSQKDKDVIKTWKLKFLEIS